MTEQMQSRPGAVSSGLDGGLPSDEYRPAEVRQAMDDYRTPDDVPDYLLQERGGKDRPETDGLWRHDIFL